jgi:DNA-binding YbaB/EbfC family protein
MKDFGDMMNQAKALQESLVTIQEEIKNISVEGESGAGLVKVSVAGDSKVREVTLDPDILNEEKSVIEELLAGAVNDAIDKLEAKKTEKMKSIGGGLLGGLGFPLGKMPF